MLAPGADLAIEAEEEGASCQLVVTQLSCKIPMPDTRSTKQKKLFDDFQPFYHVF